MELLRNFAGYFSLQCEVEQTLTLRVMGTTGGQTRIVFVGQHANRKDDVAVGGAPIILTGERPKAARPLVCDGCDRTCSLLIKFPPEKITAGILPQSQNGK